MTSKLKWQSADDNAKTDQMLESYVSKHSLKTNFLKSRKSQQEINVTRNNQIEIIELKNTITKIIKSLTGFSVEWRW